MLKQSLSVMAVLAAIIVTVVAVLNQTNHAFARRILDPWSTSAFLGVAITNQVVFSLAAYMRAQKREPLLWVSIGLGGAVAMTSWISAKYYSVELLAWLYLIMTIAIGLGGTLYVFGRERRRIANRILVGYYSEQEFALKSQAKH